MRNSFRDCTVETIDSITSTKERAAGLTGSAETIESSSVRDVGMVTGGGYVGGLAGKAKNVSRSYADVPGAARSALGGLLWLAEEGGGRSRRALRRGRFPPHRQAGRP